jgi:hypothetical protein
MPDQCQATKAYWPSECASHGSQATSNSLWQHEVGADHPGERRPPTRAPPGSTSLDSARTVSATTAPPSSPASHAHNVTNMTSVWRSR